MRVSQRPVCKQSKLAKQFDRNKCETLHTCPLLNSDEIVFLYHFIVLIHVKDGNVCKMCKSAKATRTQRKTGTVCQMTQVMASHIHDEKEMVPGRLFLLFRSEGWQKTSSGKISCNGECQLIHQTTPCVLFLCVSVPEQEAVLKATTVRSPLPAGNVVDSSLSLSSSRAGGALVGGGGSSGGGGWGGAEGGGGGGGGQGTCHPTCHKLYYHLVLRPKRTSHNYICSLRAT